MTMRQTVAEDDSLFVKEFLDKYLSLGFGNLPKKEIDILVFGLLNRYGYLKGKNNYEIARELQIDESRLRRLLLDASLRTDKNSNFQDSIKALYKELGKSIKPEIDADHKTVVMLITNPMQKRDFIHAVKLLGYSYDANLNPERIELPIHVFAAVFWQYNEDVQKQFAKLMTETLKTQTTREQAAFEAQPVLAKVEKILSVAGPVAIKTLPVLLKLISGV